MRKLTAILLVSGALALGQEGRIAGPISAHFYDEATLSLRSLVGVPGAGYFSPALTLKVENAAVSPNGRRALAVRDHQILAINLTDGTQSQIGEGTALFAWNSDSSAAAIVRINGSVGIWKPETGAFIELGAAPETTTSLAIDAAGRTVFLASNQGVTRHRENETAGSLASVPGAASLTLSADGSLLYAIDRTSRQVLEISTQSGGATLFASDAVDPTGVGLSPDNKFLLIADGESKNVLLYNRATRNLVTSIELSFSPTRLGSIGDGIFMLNTRAPQDALEVISLTPSPAAYFVPAPEED